MKFLVEIDVMPHPELLDPQGKAVKQIVTNFGIENVESLRVGKHFSLTINAATIEEAEETSKKIATQFLINPIMERFVLASISAQ